MLCEDVYKRQLLGCVYQITKEPIARQEALAQENACREVFSDAESFEAVTDFTEEAAQTVLNEGGYSTASVNAVSYTHLFPANMAAL